MGKRILPDLGVRRTLGVDAIGSCRALPDRRTESGLIHATGRAPIAMCGIAGFADKTPTASRRDSDFSLVHGMCEVIRHRGPDDEGIHVEAGAGLGMRRLSIIDLRSEEHTSELQSLAYLVCRLLLEKKKKMI